MEEVQAAGEAPQQATVVVAEEAPQVTLAVEIPVEVAAVAVAGKQAAEGRNVHRTLCGMGWMVERGKVEAGEKAEEQAA